MTVKRYLADPRTTSGTATVTSIVEGDKPYVRLSETWFHPQGGGQKADVGTLGPVRITHVAHDNGEVNHFVDTVSGLEVGKSYPLQVDANARRINAVYHSAGHLIGSAVEARAPQLKAVAGHQWPGEARVEFEGAADDLAQLQKDLEDEIYKNIQAKTPVEIIGDPFTNRAIRMGGYAPIPCGGTHVSAISEIGNIKIEGVRKKGERIRVSYKIEGV